MTIFVGPSSPVVSIQGALPRVLPEVAGCPNILAADAVFRSAVNWCRRSQSLRCAGTLTTSASSNAYAFPVPAFHALFLPLGVKNPDKSEINFASREYLNSILPSGWELETGSTFSDLWADAKSGYAFRPAPNSAVVVSYVLALEPVVGATFLDKELVDRYGDDLAAGARSILMRMRKVPWSDPAGAKDAQEQFDKGVAGASVEAAQGFTRTPLRTTSHYAIG